MKNTGQIPISVRAFRKKTQVRGIGGCSVFNVISLVGTPHSSFPIHSGLHLPQLKKKHAEVRSIQSTTPMIPTLSPHIQGVDFFWSILADPCQGVLCPLTVDSGIQVKSRNHKCVKWSFNFINFIIYPWFHGVSCAI